VEKLFESELKPGPATTVRGQQGVVQDAVDVRPRREGREAFQQRDRVEQQLDPATQFRLQMSSTVRISRSCAIDGRSTCTLSPGDVARLKMQSTLASKAWDDALAAHGDTQRREPLRSLTFGSSTA
jgi:hypothetical protein